MKHAFSVVALIIYTSVGSPAAIAQNLHAAAFQDDAKAILHLISAGADLNAKDPYGSTPLIIAATFGKTEAARILIEAGADLNIRNNDRATPLHIAAFFGRTEIVMALLDHGARKYLRNSFGNTPFESISVPFEEVRSIYDRFREVLGPLGLTLDYNEIRSARPKIAEMLRPRREELEGIMYAPVRLSDWPVSTPEEEGLDPMSLAEMYLEASQVEMLYSLLVVKNGRLIAERYFNEGSLAQKTRVQSVTKSFTSALVGIALEKGILSSVDQKMMEFFPEFADRIQDPRKKEITVRQLLQMRAGYPWEELTQKDFTTLYTGFRPMHLVAFPLSRDPGSGFEYSNLTSHLLGIILSRASGTDLKSFAQKHLFEPLQIEVGDWTTDLEGYFNGHGDMHFTARDAARFGLLYLSNGAIGGKRIVSAEWVRESLQAHSDEAWVGKDRLNNVGTYLRNLGYGYQWWSATVGARRFDFAWGHGGQLVVLLNDLDMIIVVTSNPFWRQHDDESWVHERANLNLVGKYIKSLRMN